MGAISNILKYFSIEKRSFVDYKSNIFSYTLSNVRNDAASIIKLQSGTYLLAFTQFGNSSGDSSSANLVFYTSTNKTNWSYLSTINNFATTIMIPSLYQKSNGDIVVVFLVKTSSTTSKISQKTSTDSGLTWGDTVDIHSVALEYVNIGSSKMFVTDTGRVIMPYAINTNGILPSTTGNYSGKFVYSDDECSNWSEAGVTITSPDNLCVEVGIVKKSLGVLTCYFRNRSGTVYGADSLDDGESWGAVYNLNLSAPDSESSIIALSDGSGYIGCCNRYTGGSVFGLTPRAQLQISYSANLTAWSKTTVIDGVSGSTYIEPTLYQNNGDFFIFYSSGTSDGNYYSLTFQLADINRYINNY